MKNFFYFFLLLVLLYSGNCKENKNNDSLLLGLFAIVSSNKGQQNNQVSKPYFTPLPGVVTQFSNISIATTTEGASIYYTLDGSDPTNESTQYISPLSNVWTLAGKTIKALAVKNNMINSEIETGIFSYPPLKTGQIITYSSGDDGNHQVGIQRSFIDNENGTITDTATGLVWQKCSRGQNNDSTCSGTPTTSNWNDSMNYCSSLTLAGKSWRLPTRQELETLVEHSYTSGPKINYTVFPSTPQIEYWSSTDYITNDAWAISFSDCSSLPYIKSTLHRVRCVSEPSKGYSPSFIDNGNGTITDSATGLVWQKCSRGQNNDSTCSGTIITGDWSSAINYCNSLSLAGKSWRLPNINELKSIINTNKTNSPFIDTSMFPSPPASSYWSSTTDATNINRAFDVYLFDGSVGYSLKTSTSDVRCVSGPQ